MARKDITGQRFGRLVAIRPNGKQGNNIKWLCRCDCGNEITTNVSSLTRGKTKSCGCLRKEITSKQFTKHGGRLDHLYAIYCSMKKRCKNPNDNHYEFYGGKGVKVCDEWQSNYASFKEWALQNGYSPKLSIDRIDVNGNYEPSNCRWVTMKEQANNKTNNKFIEYQGETHTIAEWARIKGLSYFSLYQRIMVHKWDIERAMTQKQRGA